VLKFCEHCSEPLDSVKSGTFFKYLNNYSYFKNISASMNYIDYLRNDTREVVSQ